MESAPIDRASTATEFSAPHAKASRCVLVVDDHVDSAEALAEFVRSLGHEALIAHDGRAALEMAIANKADVIFLDVELPDADGCDVVRSLRSHKETSQARVFALTGHGREHAARFVKAGFDAHVMKPYAIDLIADLIERAPERAKAAHR